MSMPLGRCSRCIIQRRAFSAFRPHALRPRASIRPSISTRLQTRFASGSQFQPLIPPSPESLGKASPARQYRRTRKFLRRLLYFSLGAGTIYILDISFYHSSITRSLKTFSYGLLAALDYKLNFRPHPLFGGTIGDLHRRNAERLFELLHSNGGLYLKIGQAIAMQSAVLPPEFQVMFQRMFDDAPQNSWRDVERVIREDFGKSVEEVFGVSFAPGGGKGVMERTARASASVAQVHWARLADGREVAIKVQKREIAQQVGWDLWAFKVMMRIFTYWFDMPLYSLVPYITNRLMLETDFQNEASNSIQMAELIAHEPRLAGKVYIPRVYPELSSKRIMTAEWIEGVRLWDKESLTAPWQFPSSQGSPGVRGAPLDGPDSARVTSQLRKDHPEAEFIKPERNWWKGKNGKGGLGLSTKDVMSTMVDLFSAQMFLFGLVHCDPHPGNIFIRRLPGGKPELVLIDHGLYVSMDQKFKHQYATFWKALMTFDNETVGRITREWGVNAPDLFASATLMRPYEGGSGEMREKIMKSMEGKTASERHYAMQEHAKQAIREMLADETKMPKELLFIGRNMRIVQGNNQFLGSPVNRIKMTGYWASRSLMADKSLDWRERWRNTWKHVFFTFVLWGSDIVFYTAKLRQKLGWGGGMEDEMERQLRVIAKDNFGVELQHDVFAG